MNANGQPQLIADLRRIVGDSQILTDPELVDSYTTDWTGRFHGPAVAVARPATTAEVAAILVACSAVGQPVLPQGGITGLVGASVPGPVIAGEALPVILSTCRLNEIAVVDDHSGQVIAGAGATLGALRSHVASAGWEYGVDIAARDTATIGGTLATNAGGIRVCAFGMTKAQVVGIEAVLPSGAIISHLQGLPKDNTGYDLTALLVGSEGTLGVITAATLRLHRPVAPSTLALVGVRDYTHALALIARVRSTGDRLLAAEIMDGVGTELVCELSGLPWPLASRDWAQLLVVEVEAPDIDLPEDVDAIVALDGADYQRIWTYRERQSEAALMMAPRLAGVLHKLDVSVPLRSLQHFFDDLSQLLDSDVDVLGGSVFGHIADGNLHIEIVSAAEHGERVTRATLELAGSHDGSISGEHGVGRMKAAYLSLSRTEVEIATMRAIKAALDPLAIMSPGVIFARESEQ